MNDERPIEKLLRHYAQKRRDEAGDPPVLHPATRRLLQGEVARQFPKPTAESKASGTNFFALLTGRWIYAVSVLVVLGVAAVLLLPSLNKSKSGAFLAQKEAAEEIAVRESLAPTSPSAEAQPTLAAADDRRNQPALGPSGGGNYSRLRDESATLSYTVTNGTAGSLARFADDKRDADALPKAEEAKQVSLSMSLDSAAPKSRALSVQSPVRSAGESVPADSPGLAGIARAGRDDTTDRFNESRQAAIPPPPATVTAPAPSTVLSDKTFVARGGGVEKDAARSYSQSFANVTPEQLKAKAANVQAVTPVTPVLANFQVQNVGNQLRVIDSDGSTYLGEVSATAAGQAALANFESANLRRAQTPAETAVANQQATQDYLWRVEGTNRTLNQNVVFTWNFVDLTNAVAASEAKRVSDALNYDPAKLPSQLPAMLQNSFINGRAQIGPVQQIEINAVPLKQ